MTWHCFVHWTNLALIWATIGEGFWWAIERKNAFRPSDLRVTIMPGHRFIVWVLWPWLMLMAAIAKLCSWLLW